MQKKEKEAAGFQFKSCCQLLQTKDTDISGRTRKPGVACRLNKTGASDHAHGYALYSLHNTANSP